MSELKLLERVSGTCLAGVVLISRLDIDSELLFREFLSAEATLNSAKYKILAGDLAERNAREQRRAPLCTSFDRVGEEFHQRPLAKDCQSTTALRRGSLQPV